MTGAAKRSSQGGSEGTNRTRPENVPAIERATGREWSAWVALFEAQGAPTLEHRAIAKIARAALADDLRNPEWWAQAIAIAYEQHAGLRVPGQSSAGTVGVSASRTLPLDRDDAIDAWGSAHGSRSEHLGHAASAARPSRTEKRSFWRFELEGAGKVEVSATPKGEKTSLTVSQDGLADGERIEEWRAHWKSLLAAL
ncbi:hypothetical protein PQI23_08115 [Leucobacter sp. USCH14]|uniref:hypothetical protein n=1 Tax=Leucobacter sp. USCH14 TaxID=3024838 RepID=UPI0030AD9AEA